MHFTLSQGLPTTCDIPAQASLLAQTRIGFSPASPTWVVILAPLHELTPSQFTLVALTTEPAQDRKPIQWSSGVLIISTDAAEASPEATTDPAASIFPLFAQLLSPRQTTSFSAMMLPTSKQEFVLEQFTFRPTSSPTPKHALSPPLHLTVSPPLI